MAQVVTTLRNPSTRHHKSASTRYLTTQGLEMKTQEDSHRERIEACVFVDTTTGARSIKVADALYLLSTGVTMDMLKGYV